MWPSALCVRILRAAAETLMSRDGRVVVRSPILASDTDPDLAYLQTKGTSCLQRASQTSDTGRCMHCLIASCSECIALRGSMCDVVWNGHSQSDEPVDSHLACAGDVEAPSQRLLVTLSIFQKWPSTRSSSVFGKQKMNERGISGALVLGMAMFVSSDRLFDCARKFGIYWPSFMDSSAIQVMNGLPECCKSMGPTKQLLRERKVCGAAFVR